MTWLWVAVGAAAGAPLRYLVDRTVQARHERELPWGTWVVNISGSAVLGGLLAWSGSGAGAVALVGTGFCGAFTTWSTLSYEVLVLGRTDRGRLAMGYLVLSVAAGVVGAAAGWGLVTLVTAA